MIPGAALTAWLSDGEAQQRTNDKIHDAAREWSAAPPVARLYQDIAEASPRTPATMFAIARRFMDDAEGMEAALRTLIATCRADPFFRPPFHPIASEIQDSLLLCFHRDLFISLGVTGVDLLASKKTARNGPASINFSGFPTLMRFVKAGGSTLSFWEAPAISDDFVVSQAGRCRLVGRRRIEDGEEFVVDGRYQSFVIEHSTSDIVFFQAVARAGCAPVAVEYDSDTLECIGASSTDEASSRLQMMVSLVRAMGRSDAFPLLEEALGSPQFYTRWHVMREMLALDPQAALPSLRRMAAHDPHPDVRATAEQTLRLFFESEDALEEELPARQGGTACRA